MHGTDGRDDIRVSSATANVAAHALPDLIVGDFDRTLFADIGSGEAYGIGLELFDHGDGGTDLAGSAIAALKAIMLNERSLHGVEIVSVGKSFDGGDFVAFEHDRERKAGIRLPAIDKDSAGAALAVVAAFLRAGKLEMFAKGVKKSDTRFDGKATILTVDSQCDFSGGRSLGLGLGWQKRGGSGGSGSGDKAAAR